MMLRANLNVALWVVIFFLGSLSASGQTESGRTKAERDKAAFASVRKSRDIIMLNKYATTLSKPWCDSCVILLHEAYVAAGDVELLNVFHQRYGKNSAAKKFQRKDQAIWKAARKGVTDDKFIRIAAPYPVAMLRLQGLVADHYHHHDVAGALKTVMSFADCFGDDQDYLRLVDVLHGSPTDTLTRHKLGPDVSSPVYDEYCPVVSARSDVLYFCRGKVFDHVERNVTEDVHICRLVNGEWTKVSLVPNLSDSKKNEAPLSMTADGSRMLVFVDGKICESIRSINGWSRPVPLSSNINIADWQSDAVITADGRAILFAAAKATEREVQSSGASVYRRSNIYVSLKQKDGSWGEPIDLGPRINTSLGDRSPFLHPDMKTLYFSSEGHGAIGGMDVFVSHRLRDDSWTEWSEPVNLGRSINDAEENAHYIITTDGMMAYFSASEDGKYDIYWTIIPPDKRPQPVGTLAGRLVGDDCRPHGGTVILRDAKTNKVVQRINASPIDGTFFSVCQLGRDYVCVADGIEYEIRMADKARNVHVDVPEREVRCRPELERTRIFFAKNSDVLSDEMKAKLDDLLSKMGGLQVALTLVGHTDSDADDSYNMRLSERRAENVRKYLLTNGCRAERVTYTFMGESEPIATNDTEEGMAQNRRVEVDVKFVE